jgi:hypothetical protein
MDAQRPASRRLRQAMAVGWSAFLMAGVLEALVFAVVDPQQLHGWAGAAAEWSREAVYTLSFLVFWAVIALAGCLSLLLAQEPPPEAPGRRRP